MSAVITEQNMQVLGSSSPELAAFALDGDVSVFESKIFESEVGDYFRLLKPGVMSLVVFTGWVGLLMAPGNLHPFLAFVTILCIALGSGAGAAINMWYDRDIDLLMRRTRNRPIPAGRVEASNALMLGLILAVGSVLILALATNWQAASMLAFAIWFYSVFYTMILKRRTPQNIVIGGAAGAFPPVIGWLAVTGTLSVEPIIYFLITFLWTPPHFWALALYRNQDYRDAGVPMLPVIAGVASTKKHILFYSFLLVAVSVLPSVFGQSGFLYLFLSSGLGAYFILRAFAVLKSDAPEVALGLFKYSIVYLFILFAGLVVDRMVNFPSQIIYQALNNFNL